MIYVADETLPKQIYDDWQGRKFVLTPEVEIDGSQKAMNYNIEGTSIAEWYDSARAKDWDKFKDIVKPFDLFIGTWDRMHFFCLFARRYVSIESLHWKERSYDCTGELTPKVGNCGNPIPFVDKHGDVLLNVDVTDKYWHGIRSNYTKIIHCLAKMVDTRTAKRIVKNYLGEEDDEKVS